MNPLERRIQILEGIIFKLLKTDRYVFEKLIQMADGRNIQLASGTGTQIGTASTQKLGVLGATPVAQATAIGAPTSPGGVYAQSEAQSAVTAINSLRTAIKNFGISA